MLIRSSGRASSLAFGFALGSVLARARALRRLDPAESIQANELRLRNMSSPDSVWGVAAIVLIVTGVTASADWRRSRIYSRFPSR